MNVNTARKKATASKVYPSQPDGSSEREHLTEKDDTALRPKKGSSEGIRMKNVNYMMMDDKALEKE